MGILRERVGAVEVLAIDRPEKRNALDPATIDAIGETFLEIEHDDAVAVLVITGAGRPRVLRGHGPRVVRRRSPAAARRGGRALRGLLPHRFREARRRRGERVGGGRWASSCCSRATSRSRPTTRMLGLPEVKRGLFAGAGGTLLPQAHPGGDRARARAHRRPGHRGARLRARPGQPGGARGRRARRGAWRSPQRIAANAPIAVRVTKALMYGRARVRARPGLGARDGRPARRAGHRRRARGGAGLRGEASHPAGPAPDRPRVPDVEVDALFTGARRVGVPWRRRGRRADAPTAGGRCSSPTPHPGLEHAWYAVALAEEVTETPRSVELLGRHWAVLRFDGELRRVRRSVPAPVGPAVDRHQLRRGAAVPVPRVGVRARRHVRAHPVSGRRRGDPVARERGDPGGRRRAVRAGVDRADEAARAARLRGVGRRRGSTPAATSRATRPPARSSSPTTSSTRRTCRRCTRRPSAWPTRSTCRRTRCSWTGGAGSTTYDVSYKNHDDPLVATGEHPLVQPQVLYKEFVPASTALHPPRPPAHRQADRDPVRAAARARRLDADLQADGAQRLRRRREQDATRSMIFEDLVMDEDLVVLEAYHEMGVHLDLREEVHVRTDKPVGGVPAHARVVRRRPSPLRCALRCPDAAISNGAAGRPVRDPGGGSRCPRSATRTAHAPVVVLDDVFAAGPVARRRCSRRTGRTGTRVATCRRPVPRRRCPAASPPPSACPGTARTGRSAANPLVERRRPAAALRAVRERGTRRCSAAPSCGRTPCTRNVQLPAIGTDLGHIDVPEFRGVTREHAFPVALLHLMNRSQLFTAWQLDICTAVTWLWDGPRGDFVLWERRPAASHRVATRRRSPRRAVVSDNDRVFHAVGDFASPAGPDPPDLTPTSEVHVRDDRSSSATAATSVDPGPSPRCGGRVSWKAYVFADERRGAGPRRAPRRPRRGSGAATCSRRRSTPRASPGPTRSRSTTDWCATLAAGWPKSVPVPGCA